MTLNSTTVNVARVIGPTIAAILISTIGIGWCIIVNAVSFMFVIASLLALDVGALHQIPPVPRARGQLREGLRYAARVPAIARPLLMMALVGTLAFEFEVSLPLLARSTFHGGDIAYSRLIGALGAEAVAGGLHAPPPGRARTGVRRLTGPHCSTRSRSGSRRPLPPWPPPSPRACVLVGAACLGAGAIGSRTGKVANGSDLSSGPGLPQPPGFDNDRNGRIRNVA